MNLILKSAAVAAVAAPAAALAPTSLPMAAPAAIEPSAAPAGPTEIDQLWEKREALNHQYEAGHKTRLELRRERDRRLPTPHPSIVYSPENAADGLNPATPRSAAVEGFIWPIHIEGALARARYGYNGVVTSDIVDTFAKAGGPPALTAEQTALCDRLAARLRLSQRYMRKKHQIEDETGLTAHERKMERLVARQCDIERRILSRTPMTRADMQKKLGLYDADADFVSDRAPVVVRDLRRLFEGKMTLAA